MAAYNEIYRLIENNGYALIPKAPAFLVKHFKRTSAMMIKLLFKSGALDQAKGSTKELDALYLDFKKLSNNTAISTTNLDSLYQQTMSVSDWQEIDFNNKSHFFYKSEIFLVILG